MVLRYIIEQCYGYRLNRKNNSSVTRSSVN